MAEVSYGYEKYNENYEMEYLPVNDLDGKITGKHIVGLKQYFDENPEERKRLGWIKHITHGTKEVEYNRQTQYLVKSIKQIDEYTIEDEWYIMDKTEEMLLLEEMLEALDYSGSNITFLNADRALL